MKFRYSPLKNVIVEQWPHGVGFNLKTAQSLMNFARGKSISPEQEEHLARGLVRGGFGNLAIMAHGGPDLTHGRVESTPREYNLADRVLGWYRRARESEQRKGAITDPSRMLTAKPVSPETPPSSQTHTHGSDGEGSGAAAPQAEPEAPPTEQEMADARAHWRSQDALRRTVRKQIDADLQSKLAAGAAARAGRERGSTSSGLALPVANPRMQEIAARVSKNALVPIGNRGSGRPELKQPSGWRGPRSGGIRPVG